MFSGWQAFLLGVLVGAMGILFLQGAVTVWRENRDSKKILDKHRDDPRGGRF